MSADKQQPLRLTAENVQRLQAQLIRKNNLVQQIIEEHKQNRLNALEKDSFFGNAFADEPSRWTIRSGYPVDAINAAYRAHYNLTGKERAHMQLAENVTSHGSTATAPTHEYASPPRKRSRVSSKLQHAASASSPTSPQPPQPPAPTGPSAASSQHGLASFLHPNPAAQRHNFRHPNRHAAPGPALVLRL